MSQAVMLVLAATFAVAAVAKLRAPAAFAASLETLAGSRAARPLALAVPAGELALAGALLAGVAPRAVAALALALLAAFTWALLRMRAAGAAPCNCFGARAAGDPSDGLARNAALGALALVLVIAPTSAPGWSYPVSDVVAAATVAIGVCCAWQLARALALIAGLARR
jgi:uncharacterized membrane protein YphA (DoxX/SURF4 family)